MFNKNILSEDLLKKKHLNIINCYILLIPTIFLFKHNFSNFLVSLSPLIFFFLYIKYNFFFKINKVVSIFFIYILIQSLINLNINGLYYLRFFFLFILISYLIDYKKKIFLISILKYFILFFCFDLIFQYIFGFNIFLIKNDYNIPTSFFGDEKIAGSYLYYLTIILILMSIFFKDEKTLVQIIFFSPILIFVSLITTQRMPFLNYTLLFLVIIILYFIFNKKKIVLISSFVAVSLIIFSLLIFFPNNNLFHKFGYISNYVPILQKEELKTTANLTYFNYMGYEKVEFDENVFQKLSEKEKIKNENLKLTYKIKKYTDYDNVFNYSDVFARGLLDGKWYELKISDINNSERFKDNKFHFVLENDEKSEEIKKNLNLDPAEILTTSQILNYLKENDLYKKDQIITSFASTYPINHKFIDNGWYSHAATAYKIWIENKIFGIGLKEFRNLCKDQKYWDMNSLSNVYCTTHPHNFFIEIMSETGLIGIILFYLIIFQLIFKISNSSMNLRDKLITILIIISLFQPFQITGRFFSSNVSIFNFYIISLLYYCLNKFTIR